MSHRKHYKLYKRHLRKIFGVQSMGEIKLILIKMSGWHLNRRTS